MLKESEMAASNITLTPVTSASNTTVLSSAQASQLLQRLRAGGANGSEPGAIKIQSVQTNPQTGVRQIIAIPIQTSSAQNPATKISVSPLKVGKSRSSLATFCIWHTKTTADC